jgi:hypothetical protein
MYRKICLILCLPFLLCRCYPAGSQQLTAGSVSLNHIKQRVRQSSIKDIPQPPKGGPDEPDVGSVVTPMKRGQKAPYTGVLFSKKAVSETIAEFKNKDKECKLRVDKLRKDLKAIHKLEKTKIQLELEATKKSCKIKVDARDETIQFMDKRIEKIGNPKTEMWFVIGASGGFVIGVTLAILTVFATSETLK